MSWKLPGLLSLATAMALLAWLLWVPARPDQPAARPLDRGAIEAGGDDRSAPSIGRREGPPRPTPATDTDPAAPRHDSEGARAEGTALHLQVADSRGTPIAAIPLELEWSDRGPAFWKGLSCLPAVAIPIELGERPVPGSVIARAYPDLGPAASLSIDLEPVPAGTVRLTLPPTGRLRLRLLDPDGEPADGALQLAGTWRADGREGAVSASGSEGLIVLERVGLNLDLELEARVASRVWLPQHLSGRGPETAGEERELVLRFSRASPLARGRILDAQGQPLVRTALAAVLLAGGQPTAFRQDLRTDGRGRFGLRIDEPRIPGERYQLRLERLEQNGAQLAPTGERCTIELSGLATEGPWDLGDHQLGGLH